MHAQRPSPPPPAPRPPLPQWLHGHDSSCIIIMSHRLSSPTTTNHLVELERALRVNANAQVVVQHHHLERLLATRRRRRRCHCGKQRRGVAAVGGWVRGGGGGWEGMQGCAGDGRRLGLVGQAAAGTGGLGNAARLISACTGNAAATQAGASSSSDDAHHRASAGAVCADRCALRAQVHVWMVIWPVVTAGGQARDGEAPPPLRLNAPPTGQAAGCSWWRVLVGYRRRRLGPRFERRQLQRQPQAALAPRLRRGRGRRRRRGRR